MSTWVLDLLAAGCTKHGAILEQCPVTTVLVFFAVPAGQQQDTLHPEGVYCCDLFTICQGRLTTIGVSCPNQAQRLHPTPTVKVPTWDLSLIFGLLNRHPFVPMEHSELKLLSLKTAFLLEIL